MAGAAAWPVTRGRGRTRRHAPTGCVLPEVALPPGRA